MLRFQKKIRVLPGVRLNISKSGISTSLGPKGASVNISKRGIYGNLGVPGTGLSYRQRLDAHAKSHRAPSQKPKAAPTVSKTEEEVHDTATEQARKAVSAAQSTLEDFGSPIAWRNRTDILWPGTASRKGVITRRTAATPTTAPTLARVPFMLRLVYLILAVGGLAIFRNDIQASLETVRPQVTEVASVVTFLTMAVLLAAWTARRTRHIGQPSWLGVAAVPIGFAIQPAVGGLVLLTLCLIPGKH